MSHAKRSMAVLEGILAQAHATGGLQSPVVGEVSGSLAEALTASRTVDQVLPAATHQALIHVWAGLHGSVSLEVFGHLAWLPPRARESLFDGQVRLALHAVGLAAAR